MVLFLLSPSQKLLYAEKVPILGPSPVSGSPMEIWKAASHGQEQIQANQHRRPEPTSTEELPLTAWAASTNYPKSCPGDLRQCHSFLKLGATYLSSISFVRFNVD